VNRGSVARENAIAQLARGTDGAHRDFELAREEFAIMNIGLEFQEIWNDADMIGVRVSSWNGTFGGATRVYVGIGRLEQAAATLHGFPHAPSDSRELKFAGVGMGGAPGGVGLRIYCIGGAAHAWLEARIESVYDLAGAPQSVVLSLPIEPAAVDLFVDQLHRAGASRSGIARLNGVVRL
jgi:hypothetical protein